MLLVYHKFDRVSSRLHSLRLPTLQAEVESKELDDVLLELCVIVTEPVETAQEVVEA